MDLNNQLKKTTLELKRRKAINARIIESIDRTLERTEAAQLEIEIGLN